MPAASKQPVLHTPDGRYIVVRGRLWRAANPALSEVQRRDAVSVLMEARRNVHAARLAGDQAAEASAHRAVDEAKRALGERGPPWWTDGAPDLNRRLVHKTDYGAWFASLDQAT